MITHQKRNRRGAFTSRLLINSQKGVARKLNPSLLMKYSEAIGRNPDDLKSRFLRCEFLMAMKEYYLALQDAIKVIEMDKSYRMGYYKALDCLIMIGNSSEAEDLVKKFRLIAPNIDTINRNQAPRIQRVKNLKQEINRAFETNHYPKSLKLIEEALKMSPASVELLILRMMCLICTKQFIFAKELNSEINALLDQEIRIFDALKLYYEGDLSTSEKLFAEMSSSIDRKMEVITEIQLKARQILDDINQAEIEMNKSQFKVAIEVLENCLKVDPSNMEVTKMLLIKIVQAHYDSGIDMEIACQKIERVLKMDPFYVSAMLLKAKLLLNQKMFNEALEECEKILKMNIQKKIRLEVNKLKEKIAFDMKSNTTNADEKAFYVSAMLLKAKLLLNQKMFNEALEECETILKMNIQEELRLKVNMLKLKIVLDDLNQKFNTSNADEKAESTTGSNKPKNGRQNENLDEDEPKVKETWERKTSTQYSFTAADCAEGIKHFKEFIGRPKDEKGPKDETTKSKPVQTEADKKNKEACEEYTAQRYQKALKLYSEAINLNPTCVKFLINRSACLLAMSDYNQALVDAIKAIALDPKSWKGYLRAINCFLALGNINLAKRYIEKLKTDIAGVDSIDYNEVPKLESLTQAHSKIEECYESKNFKECLKNLEIAMKIAKSCVNYQNLKAECLIMLQRFDEANEIIDEALKRDIGNANIVFLQGLQLYLDGFPRKSIVKFEAALRMNSEHVKARKHRDAAKKLVELSSQASNFYEQKNFQEACRFYSMALKIEPEIAKRKFSTLLNRGYSNFMLENFSEAIDDFSEALRINETNAKCLYIRAQSHFKLREFEDCIIDCEESLRLENSDRTEKLLADAKFNLQVTKKRSPHSILGVNSGSSNEEIKKAFRKLSLKFHSDKHPNATAIDKKKLERKFHEVKTAYEVLVASK